MKKIILTLFCLVSFFNISHTQESLNFLVAAGSSSGTYQQFLKELVAATPDSGITFKEVPSTGAIDNLDKLINNEVMGAFVHSDVLFHRNKGEIQSGLDTKFKTLLALFQEDVHFLALSQSKKTVGGTLGYGARQVVIKDVTQLVGMKVGAAGGGYITASVIKLLSDIPYQIVKFETGKDLIQALNDGIVDAAVFTGAAPLPNLKDFGPQYKLLPIPSSVAEKMKLVYRPTTITYTKMNPNSIQTVSAQCLLVSKVYRTPKMVNTLQQFRNSFMAHLDDIKEQPGNHKKWQDVTPEEHGTSWPWMEFPVTTPTK